MKKEIRVADKKRGIVQVTIADERWYMRQSEDKATGLPIFLAVPSVTWIAGHYPKGIGFYKWLADKGWDESQAIKQAAGDKGSKVHEAISAILGGTEVRIDSKFLNKTTGKVEELTLEEVDCIKSFIDWRTEFEKDYVIESIAWDMVVFSEIHNYAGTIDYIVRLTPKEDGKNPLKLTGPTPFVVDFKTSKQVWTEYELQVSAYRKAVENGENPVYERNENGTEGKLVDLSGLRTAILQVGYNLNRAGWKWNMIDDKFAVFLAAQFIWQNESSTQAPKVRDYPMVISPGKPQEEIEYGDGDEVIEVDAPEVEEPEPVQPTLVEEAKKPAKAKK